MYDDIICVTNRQLCSEDFFVRLNRIVSVKPRAVILREKELAAEEYRSMAELAIELCRRENVPCILHSFSDIAAELGADGLHLPIPLLRKLSGNLKDRFSVLGASVHSPEEAAEAESLGATYIAAGHIFPTDCKKGLPPRGLDFLNRVCNTVSVPVYAIGGITSENFASVRQAGAAGACIMSGIMTCGDPAEYLAGFRKESGK